MSDFEQTGTGDAPGIVVTGASGRMGRMLIRLLLDSDQARLVGALERPGHDWIGRDIGEAMGGQPAGVMVSDDVVTVIARACCDLALFPSADDADEHIVEETSLSAIPLANIFFCLFSLFL